MLYCVLVCSGVFWRALWCVLIGSIEFSWMLVCSSVYPFEYSPMTKKEQELIILKKGQYEGKPDKMRERDKAGSRSFIHSTIKAKKDEQCFHSRVQSIKEDISALHFP